MVRTLSISTPRQGLHEITDDVARVVADAIANHGKSGTINDERGVSGLCTVFVRHTSASLIIQENAAPSARRDLEHWLNRLVPERDAIYTHNEEGPDDMPAHIKSALTTVSLSIPIVNGRLALGRWQGIYVWEHRHARHQREVVVHVALDSP